MTSSIMLHPGFILILSGILAAIIPGIGRKIVLVAGPACALLSLLMLSYGDSWVVPFINGYELHFLEVDELNWVFALIFSMMALIGSIYSLHNKSWLEAMCSHLYAGAALVVTLCGDWMTLIFAWELMAGSSLFLIWAKKDKKSTKAGFRYLLVHMTGGNLLLAGIIIKVTQGDFLVSNITATHDAAFWLILIGVAINAAIPPLNAWLVDAYPEGTITGSVFLSSFTTKVAVYCLIRMFAGTEWLLWVGVIMALYGALFAIIENDMRRLLSYHIISQVGFMVAGVGIGTALALDGATAHAFSHILYKSLLFMCAGSIIYATGIRKINQLGGLAKKMPIVTILFFIAGFSIAGIPLFNGFISKSMTITAACEAGFPMAELLLQLASVGTFLSIVLKMGYFIFFGEDKNIEVKPIPKNMYVAMIIGASLCVLYGIFPHALYQVLPFVQEAMAYKPFTVDHVVQYVELLGMTIIPFVMYLKKMEPHTALSLDTDWFYRKPFAWLVRTISSFTVTVQVGLGAFFKGIYDAMGPIMKNPLKYIADRKVALEGVEVAPDEYNADAYRDEIGDVIIVVLVALVAAIVLIALVL